MMKQKFKTYFSPFAVPLEKTLFGTFFLAVLATISELETYLKNKKQIKI